MKEYFKYFKIIYIIFGVLLVITLGAFLPKLLVSKQENSRTNYECPEERVYDYADVLTSEEEEKLRERIAEVEKKIACDLVLVTINESIINYYGYDSNSDYNWEEAMTRYADDFYDENNYGYDIARGDGALLLDNWYKQGNSESEAGSWLSTSGAVYERYSTGMINNLLDDVYYALDNGAYRAYLTYIDHIETYMSADTKVNTPMISLFGCFMVALIPAIIFVCMHLKSKEGEKTVTQNTYVDAEGGNAVFRVKRDELVDKRVTSVRIQTNSGGGGGRSGGGRSGGRGGSHRSSSGSRHGGGGRRR